MSDFDKDPWLLGAPNGIVDLRTGQFRSARPEDMVSRQVLVDPADTADCPKFMVFLDEVTQGDKKIIQFLQEWFGYGMRSNGPSGWSILLRVQILKTVPHETLKERFRRAGCPSVQVNDIGAQRVPNRAYPVTSEES